MELLRLLGGLIGRGRSRRNSRITMRNRLEVVKCDEPPLLNGQGSPVIEQRYPKRKEGGVGELGERTDGILTRGEVWDRFAQSRIIAPSETLEEHPLGERGDKRDAGVGESELPLSELGEDVLPFPQPLPPGVKGDTSRFPLLSPFYYDPDLLEAARLLDEED